MATEPLAMLLTGPVALDLATKGRPPGLIAAPADVRQLLEYLEKINQSRERPRWYNALTDNGTTAIQRLARSGERRSWWSSINERVKAAGDDPRCSVRIRKGLPRMSLDHGGAG